MVGISRRSSSSGIMARGSNFRQSFREFLKHPNLVGSAFPASRHLVDRLLAPVDWSRTKLAVEYGPGTGPLTRAILARMPADARLISLDVSSAFIRHLRRTISDPRLIAVAASASSIREIVERRGLGSADLIVTGVPFSTLPAREGGRIMRESANILGPNGLLLAYQMRTAIASLLTDHFANVRKSFVWRNIPPCHLYQARSPHKTRALRSI